MFAQDQAVAYRVVVDFNWTGDQMPEGTDWSRMIAVGHNARYRLFADGDTASRGLALVATNDRVTVLDAGVPVVRPGLSDSVAQFEF